MILRPYDDADLAAVMRVFTDAVHGLTAEHYDATQREAWAPSEPDIDQWRSRMARLRAVVAEEDGAVAGFVGYEENGLIDLLFVAPSHAGRGVASALYREVEAELVRLGATEAFTQASAISKPFFAKHGFEVVEERAVERRGATLTCYGMRKRL